MGPTAIARRLGISVKAVKTYERARWLRPKRTAQGWRTYDEADVERLARALRFKAMGFSLSQISGLLDAGPAEVANAIAVQERLMLRRRAEMDAMLETLREARGATPPALRLAA